MSHYGTIGEAPGFRNLDDTDEFDSLCNEVSEIVLQIRSCATELGKLQRSGNRDRLISKVEEILSECSLKGAQASNLLSQLHDMVRSSTSKGQELKVKKINNDLKNALRDLTNKANEVKNYIESSPDPQRSPAPQRPKQRGFQDSTDSSASPWQVGVAAKPRPVSPPPPYVTPTEQGSGVGDTLGSSRHQQVQDEHDLVTMIDRTKAIAKLEQDIVGLNEIMRDINALVFEQGEMIGRLEDAVDVAQTNVLVGNKQLNSALRAKKCNRRLTCCIATIVLIVIVIILIAILVGVCGVAKWCQK